MTSDNPTAAPRPAVNPFAPAPAAPSSAPAAPSSAPTAPSSAPTAPFSTPAAPSSEPAALSSSEPAALSSAEPAAPSSAPAAAQGEHAPLPKVVRTRQQLRVFPRRGRIAVVMTMGALHAGHAALLRAARKEADFVIATIFVNPLQFGPNEDLARYPRTFEADLAVCQAEGVDLIFAPAPDEIYPNNEPSVTVQPGSLADQLEGAVRPGHFSGVLTVVLKLLNLTEADVAYFGEKDYQQLTLIRAMVRDLDVPVEIVGVPTVREHDGLALSSRNRYLSPAERELSLALSRALTRGASQSTADAVLAAARQQLSDAGVEIDYLELRDPDLGSPPATGPARLLVAARVGTTRLIDNVELELR